MCYRTDVRLIFKQCNRSCGEYIETWYMILKISRTKTSSVGVQASERTRFYFRHMHLLACLLQLSLSGQYHTSQFSNSGYLCTINQGHLPL